MLQLPDKIKSIYELLTTNYRPVMEGCLRAAREYVAAKENRAGATQ